jgi:2-iminobutanoate/2-iminopropanoate deaminase
MECWRAIRCTFRDGSGWIQRRARAPVSIDAELELLFEGFQAVLREAGMAMDDLVWVQVYSPDVSLWQQFNAAYVRFFTREFPARAFLGSGPLLFNGRFEMLGIAVKTQTA